MMRIGWNSEKKKVGIGRLIKNFLAGLEFLNSAGLACGRF